MMVEPVDLTALFDRLSRSAFRRRFRLREPERGVQAELDFGDPYSP
jgi:hypothetical protein